MRETRRSEAMRSPNRVPLEDRVRSFPIPKLEEYPMPPGPPSERGRRRAWKRLGPVGQLEWIERELTPERQEQLLRTQYELSFCPLCQQDRSYQQVVIVGCATRHRACRGCLLGWLAHGFPKCPHAGCKNVIQSVEGLWIPQVTDEVARELVRGAAQEVGRCCVCEQTVKRRIDPTICGRCLRPYHTQECGTKQKVRGICNTCVTELKDLGIHHVLEPCPRESSEDEGEAKVRRFDLRTETYLDL